MTTTFMLSVRNERSAKKEVVERENDHYAAFLASTFSGKISQPAGFRITR